MITGAARSSDYITGTLKSLLWRPGNQGINLKVFLYHIQDLKQPPIY